MKPVVVTGMGCVSPFGAGISAFTKGLWEGKYTGGPITKFDTSTFPVKKACEAQDFRKKIRSSVLDPFIQYGLAAAREAIQDSALEISNMDPYRVATTVSSSKGGITTLERFHIRFVERPTALLGARVYANLITNILSQWIARKWKLHGPAQPVVAACATGTMALIEGIRIIEDDEADVCFAGASDASITPLLLAGYHQLGVLTTDEIRPYDRRRSGFVVGEGAGVVILESEAHAKSRKAKIYGHILSYAFGCESKDIILFPPDGEGLKNTLKRLVQKAKISPREIDTFQLHGTGTQGGDLYETVQIKKAFGSDAQNISMCSIKSMIGHTIGASGAFSFIASLLSLKDQIVPPTIHLEEADPQCDLDYTPGKAKQKKINIAGSLSMGFGGHIGAILVTR